jgi:hypothetical protein
LCGGLFWLIFGYPALRVFYFLGCGPPPPPPPPESWACRNAARARTHTARARTARSPVPVPVPDLPGDGHGTFVPDLPGTRSGDAPPSPSPICPESGTLPGLLKSGPDQAGVP